MTAPAPTATPEGFVSAEILRAGDSFYRMGHSIGECDGGMIMELLPMTVLRDGEPDTTSDPAGRELIKFWCRADLTGHEGWVRFGPGGVARVKPAAPYFIVAGVAGG
jgi:hypothetical protein